MLSLNAPLLQLTHPGSGPIGDHCEGHILPANCALGQRVHLTNVVQSGILCAEDMVHLLQPLPALTSVRLPSCQILTKLQVR